MNEQPAATEALEISDLRAMLASETPTAEAAPEAPATPAAAEPAESVKTAPDSEPEKKTEGTQRGPDGKFKAAKPDEEALQPGDTPNVQARISKLVKAQREAERERDELKAKLASGPQPATKTAPPVETLAEPDPAKFETYEAYIKALTTWQIDARDAARQNAEAQRKQADVFKTREEAARAAHPDYDEVLAGAASLPISQVMHAAIVESDIGPRLAYFLATNPDEAARICALSPNAGAREMGKLEAKLTAPPPAAAPSNTPKPQKLPRPPAVVGGTHTPNDVDLNDPDLDVRTFKREFARRLQRS